MVLKNRIFASIEADFSPLIKLRISLGFSQNIIMNNKKKITIIGGGAAGFFCAANLDENKFNVTILEQNQDVLQKVKISGGGRCNVTHA